MIIKCDMCNNVLKKQGGLLWSPPVDGKCDKYHLCINCYAKLLTYLARFKVGDKRARDFIKKEKI